MKLTHTLYLAAGLLLAACKPEDAQPAPQPADETSAQEAAAPQSAQETPTPDQEDAAVGETVPEALQGIITFNGTPSQDAKYYIYLQSASWCGPCRAEMPDIVAAYPEMKDARVELILIGCDDTVEASQKYLDSYGAKFPGIHYKESELKTLPGYTPAPGIPDATVVDREGRQVARGHGSLVKRWKEVIARYENRNKPTESPVQQPSTDEPGGSQEE